MHHDIRCSGAFCFSNNGTTPGTLRILATENVPGLPIAADKDGHVVAATSAVALALATGKLDVCVQGLFGVGKSRAAAILLPGLMALDTEGECHFFKLCAKKIQAPEASLKWLNIWSSPLKCINVSDALSLTEKLRMKPAHTLTFVIRQDLKGSRSVGYL